jgi:hypothetical protein
VHDLAERVEVRAAVGVLHTLRPAGGARGVVDGDAARLVADLPCEGLVVAAGEQVLVRDAAAGAVAGLGGVDDRDDLLDRLEPAHERRHRRVQRRVDDQQLRAGVVEDVAHLLGGEPGVDRDEHGARQRHGEVGHEHLGDVGQQVRHPVALADPGTAQRVRHTRDLGGELGVGVPAVAVDDGGLVGEDLGRALQERQRGEWGVPDGGHLASLRVVLDPRCCGAARQPEKCASRVTDTGSP